MSVRLPGSSRTTSELGFGCAYLVGGWELSESMKRLDIAYEAGFRHFDTAPAYGMGTSESVIGRALNGRRTNVTLASKVGIGRPHFGRLFHFGRAMSRSFRAAAPGMARNIGGMAYSIATPHGEFGLFKVERSLSESLRALRTDYLDLLLLHDVRSSDISHELLAFLDRQKRNGVVLALGIATSATEIELIRKRHGPFFDVWQHSWSVLDDSNSTPVPFTITHRAIHGAFDALRKWLRDDSSVAARLSDIICLDLSDPIQLSRVLIGASIANNPHGITLVSSRNLNRIFDNALPLRDSTLVEIGGRLIKALRDEPQRPRSQGC
jgi:aryl-alcohol dehydrogenase-like predicted oxidoreductase